jgi:phosphoribosyl 1,2-cyclic phosphodiesterase
MDYIKFLGTAGARFVMIKQLRHSGGQWISRGKTNVLIDPGPGSLSRCAACRPRLDPATLDAIILTHRHLDHCGDINVMIEAMTEGGFKKRGEIFCPMDALEGDPVIFRYLRGFPEKITVLEPNKEYSCGDFKFSTSMRHLHPVETYGLKFQLGKTKVAYMVDTGYFPELSGGFYSSDCLIVGVVLLEPRPTIMHLSIPEVKELLEKIRPGRAVLTHFGMHILKAHPREIAERLSKELGMDILAASDGLKLEFP